MIHPPPTELDCVILLCLFQTKMEMYEGEPRRLATLRHNTSLAVASAIDVALFKAKPATTTDTTVKTEPAADDTIVKTQPAAPAFVKAEPAAAAFVKTEPAAAFVKRSPPPPPYKQSPLLPQPYKWSPPPLPAPPTYTISGTARQCLPGC